MSHCEDSSGRGRHRAIFLTPEDADPESSRESEPPDDPEEDHPPGILNPDGSINWNCPCLGGMPSGPCGVEFRTAFECFHYRWGDERRTIAVVSSIGSGCCCMLLLLLLPLKLRNDYAATVVIRPIRSCRGRLLLLLNIMMLLLLLFLVLLLPLTLSHNKPHKS